MLNFKSFYLFIAICDNKRRDALPLFNVNENSRARSRGEESGGFVFLGAQY